MRLACKCPTSIASFRRSICIRPLAATCRCFDRLAASTRDQNQFRAFFRSATALGRISSLFIAGAGPMFFMGYALLEPEYAEFFFSSQVGIMTLIMALSSRNHRLDLVVVHHSDRVLMFPSPPVLPGGERG